MPLDWLERSALERRMQGAVFRGISRSLARAVTRQSLADLFDTAASLGASHEDVLFAVQCHGVAAHLLALEQRQPGLMSPGLSDALRAEAARIDVRGAWLAEDLRRLGRAAAAAGLPFTPLKGSFLRSERYQHPSLRPSADIDLLIGRDDLPAWRTLLRAQGYTVEGSLRRHWIFERPDRLKAVTQGEDPTHPRPVELHDRLHESVLGRSIDITHAYVADTHEGSMLGDVPARLPGPVALGLHLFLHAAPAMLDRGLRLAQVLDLGFVDGSPATVAALKSHLGEVTWAVAALADRDLPGLLSPHLSRELAELAPGRTRRRVILSRPGLLRGDPHRLHTLIGELLLTRSPRKVVHRVRAAWRDRAALASETGRSGLAPRLAVLRAYVRAAARRPR